jgi:hypothetical protein
METFSIEFDYEKKHYECFVQKIKSKTEDVYILNFKDSILIRQFKATKIVLSSTHTSTSNDVGFTENAWNAIIQKEAEK